MNKLKWSTNIENSVVKKVKNKLDKHNIKYEIKEAKYVNDENRKYCKGLYLSEKDNDYKIFKLINENNVKNT